MVFHLDNSVCKGDAKEWGIEGLKTLLISDMPPKVRQKNIWEAYQLKSISARTYFYTCVYLSGDFSCSLYRLQLKFEETTRVVCADFAEVLSLGSAGSSLIAFTWKFSYS